MEGSEPGFVFGTIGESCVCVEGCALYAEEKKSKKEKAKEDKCVEKCPRWHKEEDGYCKKEKWQLTLIITFSVIAGIIIIVLGILHLCC